MSERPRKRIPLVPDREGFPPVPLLADGTPSHTKNVGTLALIRPKDVPRDDWFREVTTGKTPR